MATKLTVLGGGTMRLTKERYSSSFLVESDGTRVLLDCGIGALARMAEQGIDPRSLSAVAISHFHADHLGDGFNLVASRFVADIYAKEQSSELIMLGPNDLEASFARWRSIFWREPDEHYPLRFVEGSNQRETFGPIQIETFPIVHVPWFESVGFRVAIGDTVIVYPGDLGSNQPWDSLVSAARDATLLIVELGYPQPTPNHFHISQTERLVKEANIQRVLLAHLRDDDRAKQIVSERSNFMYATDGDLIEL